ncbi:MAG: hypothetical protein JWM80_1820 [Cyanobacteria bacterium RYN_339]|nr:hypothetical protein [Cyanobacteria bacterium RYN_339]
MRIMSENWWAPVVRGIIAIAFGITAAMLPGAALTAFVYLFGVYALVDGITSIAALASGTVRGNDWWILMFGAAAGVFTGLVAFFVPGVTALALLFLIAARAVITGVAELMAAYELRNRVPGVGMLAAGGLLSVVAGMAMFIFPAAGALAVAWLIGGYAIAFGILAIVLGVTLRSQRDRLPSLRHTMAPTIEERELEPTQRR